MNIFSFITSNWTAVSLGLSRHVYLVLVSVGLGTAVALPLGIILTRNRRLAGPVLAFTGMVQTVPGLVMLGLALIVLGIGLLPAVVVLSIYAVLPILRNTYTGICEVEQSYIEAARGIGMTGMQTLFRVELPLAIPSIISGIRISAVYIVSWATLAALIGAGGLGDLIWTGLSTYNSSYIMAGAIPSAALAFLFSGAIGLLQRIITPRGLRRGKI